MYLAQWLENVFCRAYKLDFFFIYSGVQGRLKKAGEAKLLSHRIHIHANAMHLRGFSFCVHFQLINKKTNKKKKTMTFVLKFDTQNNRAHLLH